MPLTVIGLSHHSAPVTVRERFAFPEAAIPGALAEMRQTGAVDEAVILSTCNRVELYAAGPKPPADILAELRKFLLTRHHLAEDAPDALYTFTEPQSLEHLFRVASGLDSMVLGETEILGQLKKAYDLALQQRQTGPCLNRAFQKAFNVAKQVRTETNIQRGSISVGSAAVDLAEKIFSSVSDRHVLVIGAGDTSEKTARSLLSRGAKSILVCNRSHERAVALAESLGGRAIRYEDWPIEFAHIDIVISSTSAPHYVLDRSKLEPLMKARKNRALLLIDIAVPRDIDPEVNFLENIYLYNIDDLQSIADDCLKMRQEEISRCESIIREKARELAARSPGNCAAPAAKPAVVQET